MKVQSFERVSSYQLKGFVEVPHSLIHISFSFGPNFDQELRSHPRIDDDYDAVDRRHRRHS